MGTEIWRAREGQVREGQAEERGCAGIASSPRILRSLDTPVDLTWAVSEKEHVGIGAEGRGKTLVPLPHLLHR